MFPNLFKVILSKTLIVLCIFFAFCLSTLLITGQVYSSGNKIRFADHIIRANPDGLALYPTDKVIIGSMDFSIDEFSKDQLKELDKSVPDFLDKLKTEIEKENNDETKRRLARLFECKDTISTLNTIMEITDLYDLYNKVKKSKLFSGSIIKLAEETKNYRQEQLSKLNNAQKDKIRELNRYLLEKTFLNNIWVTAGTVNRKEYREDKFKKYVYAILEKAKSLSDKKNSEKVVKILIHIHGGLVKYEHTDKKVNELAEKIMNDGTDWHYPIFFSWKSDFLDTYFEQIGWIRQGVKTKNIFAGPVSSPIISAVHILKGISQLPMTWYYISANWKDRLAEQGILPKRALSHMWEEADKKYKQYSKYEDGEVDILSGSYWNSRKDKLGRYAKYTITAPIRVVFGGIGLSEFGERTWGNMKRRTSNIFFPVSIFDDRHDDGIAAGHFFKILFEQINNTNEYEFEITLIGHSMGTVILNKMIMNNLEIIKKGKSIKNIVYMVAACSINDAKNAIIPLLKAIELENIDGNERASDGDSHFYNLTLNRIAEISEPVAFSLGPFGTPLHYIDQHYEHPEMQLDRTLGTEINVLTSIDAFENDKEISDNIHLKSFDSYDGHVPSRHGEFNESPFWRKSFWKTDNKTITIMDKKREIQLNCYPEDWKQREEKGCRDYY